ncbi:hypothetical protein SMICM17S_04444 [Streptomyces microflavus]
MEDGRLGLKRLEADSRDLVVGDAFGGVSVPWHLTTTEALRDVHRALKDDGLYAANLIDHGRLAFARAEVATLARVFEHVAVMGAPVDIGLDPAATPVGGNLVVLASDRPFDTAIQKALDTRETGWRIATGDTVTAWTGGVPVLTDDHAPGGPAPPAAPHANRTVTPGASKGLTVPGQGLTRARTGGLTRARTATAPRTRRPPPPARRGCPVR